jgi:hypothetical protein
LICEVQPHGGKGAVMAVPQGSMRRGDEPGDRPSKKKFFTEHPEKKNIEPKSRGCYPTGHETTRVELGAKSAPPKAKKQIKSLIDCQVGGNGDPKKRT